jgi:hypothetical protein
MNLADLIRAACVKQNPLGRRGFTRVNMGDNADIAYFVEFDLTWHTRHILLT